MWQDVQRRNRTGLNKPTDAELHFAIEKLFYHMDLNRSFCFFIDELDEINGGYYEMVKFIKKTVQNPRIKVIVSSRPIPIFVSELSQFPSLRLQDPNGGDSTTCIQDTVGSHSYMQILAVSDLVVSGILLHELIKKAPGILLLWDVLACQSVIEGFAAYDNI
ncbi:hypothetical protein NPX13_g3728 [Xylaria arbuscula]|uniref:Uncharacterized protein n=1 Tax=Xylaria arbuscula TaxID=114810 RepID=A0A9W8NH76_9PEZI|nr:hypothetical protein NPX13_g3728 [Xylaria arbuscula]